MKKEEVKQYVKNWMDGHEADTFIKNQNGVVIYSAGASSLNLTVFFEELLNDYFELNSPKQPVILAKEWLMSKGITKCTMYTDSSRNYYLDGVAELLEEYRNQPAKFTPERTPKEEADRLVNDYDRCTTLTRRKCHIPATLDIQNTITALQLRGIDTTFEEQVLTILKGM